MGSASFYSDWLSDLKKQVMGSEDDENSSSSNNNGGGDGHDGFQPFASQPAQQQPPPLQSNTVPKVTCPLCHRTMGEYYNAEEDKLRMWCRAGC